MFETFEKLPESKKTQILQVCIEEFAQKGFVSTSTNTIVKRLGISKGVLFLYFKNKKNLYLYLVEYLSRVMVDDFFKQFVEEGTALAIDVFDNLGEYYKQLIQEKPEYFVFMLEAFLNSPEELKGEIESVHEQAHASILLNLKTAGFRKEIDIQMVMDLLHMVSFYVGQLICRDYNAGTDKVEGNVEDYVEIYTKYMDIIKYGVYER